MLENPAPSHRKYSADPAEQAFAEHVERQTMRIGASLIGLFAGGRAVNLSSLQDLVWEQSLDFVVPLEPEIRDRLRAAQTGLPWSGRGEIELYWRLLYAGYVEFILDTRVDAFDERTVRRPIKHVVSAATILIGQMTKREGGSDPDFLAALLKPGATPIGKALYHGIVAHAGDQLRIRNGLRRAPKPLELSSRVLAGDVACLVEGYGFDGTVTVSRETSPTDPGSLAWKLDAKSGRWRADAWPWQLEPVP